MSIHTRRGTSSSCLRIGLLCGQSDSLELFNPLMDTVETLDDGTVVLVGNRALINLNLSSKCHSLLKRKAGISRVNSRHHFVIIITYSSYPCSV